MAPAARWWVAGLVVAAAACGEADDAVSSGGPDVTCTVGYRPAATETLDVQEVEVARASAETLAFDDVVITLSYDVSANEVPALRIDAALPEGEGPFSRSLYQFVDADPPAAFAGDTGFTGLTYVYPPGSTAEAQYLCTAG